MARRTRARLWLPLALACTLAAAAACDESGALPVDDPEATAERLEREARVRSWDLPGRFTLLSQGPLHNEEAAALSPDPNRRRDAFARWGRVVAFNQEFLSEDGSLAVRYQTVVYRTEDGARRLLEETPEVFQRSQVSLTRSAVELASPPGDEARAYRLAYGNPDQGQAEGHYIAWRRGRIVMSVQTVVFGSTADQDRAEELAAALDQRFAESGVR